MSSADFFPGMLSIKTHYDYSKLYIQRACIVVPASFRHRRDVLRSGRCRDGVGATLRATQGKFDVIYLKFMLMISICNSIHNNCFELSLAMAYDSRVLMSFVISCGCYSINSESIPSGHMT